MVRENNNGDGEQNSEVVVSAPTVEGIAAAIGATIDGEDTEDAEKNGGESESSQEDLKPVVEALNDVIEGLKIATEKDSRGKMRKKVMEYSGREDMANWEFGRHLEVLQTHGIAEKDGKRWRLAD